MSITKQFAPTAADPKSVESQRGFTLVELAIVLVIIGLVIAAVLKGQELIVSARLKSTINQISGVRSATNTFRDKYNARPGDYSAGNARVGVPAGVTFAVDGNGDGIVDGDGVAAAAAGEETVLFWNHLSAANLITGVSPLGGGTLGDGLPTSPLGGGLTIRNEAVIARTSHWISLGSAAATPTGVASAEQALQIDEKSDDGRPGTGNIRTSTATCTDAGTVAVSSTSAYLADPGITGCLVRFQL